MARWLPGTTGKKMLLFFWQSNNLGVLYSVEIRGAIMRLEAQRQDSWTECTQIREKALWSNCCLSMCIVSKPKPSMNRDQSGRQKPSKQQLGFPIFHHSSSQHFLPLLILFLSHKNMCMSYLSAVVTGVYFMIFFPIYYTVQCL